MLRSTWLASIEKRRNDVVGTGDRNFLDEQARSARTCSVHWFMCSSYLCIPNANAECWNGVPIGGLSSKEAAVYLYLYTLYKQANSTTAQPNLENAPKNEKY